MTTSKSYDFLNRLLSISSSSSSSVSSSFSYVYNDANQRIRSTLADGSYWIYAYDALGQVKSGHRYWADGTPVAGQQFDYGFDDIGNRTSTLTGGDQNGASQRSTDYTSDRLNRYASRTFNPRALDVMGIALATSAVTITVDSTPYTPIRQGEYFRKEINCDSNPTQPLYKDVHVNAAGQTEVLRHEFLPPKTEPFWYDDDGNLTSDGQWIYTWDGENRLIAITARNTNPQVGPQQKIVFGYDWKGRRITKKVYNNVNGTEPPALSELFLYDGWNLLAELDALYAPPARTLLRSYAWGSDLSGSMQGAGGVGGLLWVRNHADSSAHFAAYDGNGNVLGLISTSGAKTAVYEYGPFGELIRATGSMAKANPFRFSTKYQDDETDLLYYGYRYYTASTGRWLSRDPSGERGGLNLFCFVSNDAMSHNDRLGLMKYSQIYAELLKMEAELRKQRCCCMDCNKRPSVDISLQGTASGDQVTMTVTNASSACVEELHYFWWDCFKAQAEAPSGGTDSAWKEYGWRPGGETDGRSETGSLDQDRADSHHWNWQVLVIFTYCGRDERKHAGARTSNAVIWTYSPTGWSNPQDGSGGGTY